MKITYESYGYQSATKKHGYGPEEVDLEDFVSRELERCGGNQLDSASSNADSAQRAIGILVATLAAKGILNLNDVLTIVGRDDANKWSMPESAEMQQHHALKAP